MRDFPICFFTRDQYECDGPYEQGHAQNWIEPLPTCAFILGEENVAD